MNIDYIYDVLHDMNGFGLSDFLNDFNPSLDPNMEYWSSGWGEMVRNNKGFEFSNWSEFSHKVEEYFISWENEIKERGEGFTDEEIIAIIVYKICQNLGLDVHIPPKGYYRFSNLSLI